MRIDQANADDVGGLAELLFLNSGQEERERQSFDTFTSDLAQWWSAHEHTHFAFVARPARPAQPAPPHRPTIVGMAWVALVPRVPRPGDTTRMSADIQSVFVVPDQRGQGIGSALVQAASDFAIQRGAPRITVHSGRRAVPLYERLGFESSRQLLQRPPK
ncbi:MAG: GNAT family N-acetyltransferase [Actinomycetota bacterium]|nr:GNAT family N-acetyltransferase [Actinomycetota bacterium]